MSPAPRHAGISLVLCLTSVSGCRNHPAPVTGTVVDSAGVAVVTNTTAFSTAESRLRLDTMPAVDIGGRSDDKRYDLVNIGDALRLPDGRVVVMANGSFDVRYFDAAGRHLLTVGRKGDGPGEFRGVEHLYHGGGDTVFAYDYQLRRLTRIDPDGHFGPILTNGVLDGTAEIEPVGRLADGSWIGISRSFLMHPSPTVQRDTIGIVHLNARFDSITAMVGRFPGTEQYVMTHGEGRQQTIRSLGVPFGLGTFVAVHGSTTWIGDAVRSEVQGYRADGKLTRIVRSAASRRPVTPSDLDRAKRAELEAAGSRYAEAVQGRWQVVPVPRLHPAFGAIVVDDVGRIWMLASKVVPTDSGQVTVFDAEGRFTGTVMLPPRFTPTDIGADFILGVWTDMDDLEHIRIYRLHRR